MSTPAVQARLVAGMREIAARLGHGMLIQDCPRVMMCYPADLDRAWNTQVCATGMR